jgi:hypothetical protein
MIADGDVDPTVGPAGLAEVHPLRFAVTTIAAATMTNR